MDRLGLSHQAPQIEEAFRIASMENIGKLSFYRGVVDTLSRLHSAGIKLGIVTSKDALRASAILAMLPLEFAWVETPNAMLRGKPAPDSLLMAMARTNVDPGETLYVGDMGADHEAALRAGIDYAHAVWGYGGTPNDGSTVLTSMGDLLSWLKAGDLPDPSTQ
jgi:HAD superfamily hydrolase (TIGR01549 family)